MTGTAILVAVAVLGCRTASPSSDHLPATEVTLTSCPDNRDLLPDPDQPLQRLVKIGCPKGTCRLETRLEPTKVQTSIEGATLVVTTVAGDLVDSCVDERDRFEGPYVVWSQPAGQKLVEGAYHGGKQVGVWSEYDRAGRKISEGTYLAGTKVGVWSQYDDAKLSHVDEYDDTGSRILDEDRRGNVRHGRSWRRFRSDDVELVEYGSYRDGTKHCEWTILRQGASRPQRYELYRSGELLATDPNAGPIGPDPSFTERCRAGRE